MDDLATLEDLFKLELLSHTKHKRYRMPQATISELLGSEKKSRTSGTRKETHAKDNDSRLATSDTETERKRTPPNPRRRKTPSGDSPPPAGSQCTTTQETQKGTPSLEYHRQHSSHKVTPHIVPFKFY